MPRLWERSDGCYYIVGFHHGGGFRTWQVDGEGGRFLLERGIHAYGTYLWAQGIYADGTISKELCVTMLNRGLIYTKGTREKMRLRKQNWKAKRDSRVAHGEGFSWGEWWEI